MVIRWHGWLTTNWNFTLQKSLTLMASCHPSLHDSPFLSLKKPFPFSLSKSEILWKQTRLPKSAVIFLAFAFICTKPAVLLCCVWMDLLFPSLLFFCFSFFWRAFVAFSISLSLLNFHYLY